jgi:CarD family transcriptional regulator
MKKINLKSILKKTFKKRKKTASKEKTKTKVKKNKVIKLKNKVGRPKLKKSKKKVAKEPKKLVAIKPKSQENLRLAKNQDQKPEIVKIKKQDTEKKEYKIKDYVVYPKDGVGQIIEIKKITIGGIDVEVYIIKLVKEKVDLKFPINKQSLLRPLATVNQLNKCISILKGKPKIKRSMWSRRAQEYDAKITSGKIYELAEVVRDLNKGDDILIDQSYSERQLFEKAYDRLLSEFQIVLKLSPEDTQKKLDKALKRNLEKNQQNIEKKVQINPQDNQETEGSESLVNETEEE